MRCRHAKRSSRQARPWQQTDYNELIVLFFDFIGKSHYLCTAFHRKAKKGRSNGGIGRHEGLKILWHLNAVRVQVPLRVLSRTLIACFSSS